ncbi:hypothetical protein [Scytonema sp. NUACC26]|uniref:hypothetical protein n=1 Tax=Scytonema sp. NUACC26 TaxID=3140176 RepID=UPI0034DB8E57
MCDYEHPKVWNEVERVSRKQHKCSECDRQINKGTKYWYISGLWFDKWETYKMCIDCHKIHNKCREKMDCGAPMGGLIQECIDSGILDWSDEDKDGEPIYESAVDWLIVESQYPELRISYVE